jgi:hypothetical protein
LTLEPPSRQEDPPMTVPSRADTGLDAEFDRQVEALLEAGYARSAGLAAEELAALLESLRAHVRERPGDGEEDGREHVPFVLVVTSALLPVETRMALTALDGRPGTVSAHLSDVQRFAAVDELPPGAVYVVHDVERGSRYRDRAPDDALVEIRARERSPLTVDEGIALLTLFPGSLEKNHCFSLAGSRCGDRRVPAVWISRRAPVLGWCWAGNPHSWLGCASCTGRSGRESL